MRFVTRAAPLVLIVGMALGCGKDGGEKGPVKKFEGAMPTAGAADVTIHLSLA
jgi:hypothetical protein